MPPVYRVSKVCSSVVENWRCRNGRGRRGRGARRWNAAAGGRACCGRGELEGGAGDRGQGMWRGTGIDAEKRLPETMTGRPGIEPTTYANPSDSLRRSAANRRCSAAGRPFRSSASASTRRVIAASTRVRPAGLISTSTPRPSFGSVCARHEPARDEPVDAVRHRAARDEGLLSSASGRAGRGCPARRSAESTSNSHDSSSERSNACLRARSSCFERRRDAREHLQRREVEVGPLAFPVVDDPVDLVSIRPCRHYRAGGCPALAYASASRQRLCRDVRAHADVADLVARSAAPLGAVRHGVTAARQPLEL